MPAPLRRRLFSLAQEPRRRRPHLGAAWNYNRVVSLATGEYFKWAAHDDLCAPEYLSRCVEALDRNPSVVLSYPKTAIINEHGNIIREYEDGLDLRCPVPSCRFRRAIHKTGKCNAVFGVIRSDILRRTSLIGNYIASDRVLLVELSLCGQFCEIPERLFFRRHHPRASSSNKTLHAQQEFFDPKTKGRPFMRCWKHLFRYLAIVRRAPLRTVDKVDALFHVLVIAVAWRRGLDTEPFKVVRQIAARFV